MAETGLWWPASERPPVGLRPAATGIVSGGMGIPAPTGPTRRARPRPRVWARAAPSVAVAVVVVAVIGLTSPEPAHAQGIAPSTTTAPDSSSTTVPKSSSGSSVPTGAVAYVTADGGV